MSPNRVEGLCTISAFCHCMINPILANVWNPCMGWGRGGGVKLTPHSIFEIWRSNVTCYTFLERSRSLSKESAILFAHLQKLGALFAKKTYKAKKCSIFFKIRLVIHFLKAIVIDIFCYTLSFRICKNICKISNNLGNNQEKKKYAFLLHWSVLQKKLCKILLIFLSNFA